MGVAGQGAETSHQGLDGTLAAAAALGEPGVSREAIVLAPAQGEAVLGGLGRPRHRPPGWGREPSIPWFDDLAPELPPFRLAGIPDRLALATHRTQRIHPHREPHRTITEAPAVAGVEAGHRRPEGGHGALSLPGAADEVGHECGAHAGATDLGEHGDRFHRCRRDRVAAVALLDRRQRVAAHDAAAQPGETEVDVAAQLLRGGRRGRGVPDEALGVDLGEVGPVLVALRSDDLQSIHAGRVYGRSVEVSAAREGRIASRW